MSNATPYYYATPADNGTWDVVEAVGNTSTVYANWADQVSACDDAEALNILETL